jgi:hypothetical protein
VRAIKLARFGEFEDEWEGLCQSEYEDKLQRYSERHARRWANRYAAKTLFFAAVEWAKGLPTTPRVALCRPQTT